MGTLNPEAIRSMRAAGKLLAEVLGRLAAEAREGVSLEALDSIARSLIEAGGGSPAFLGYQPDGARRPFPATICASLNEVVVHGVPSARRLVGGDILKLDTGVRYRGYCADAAITVGVGEISKEAKQLIEAAHEALDAGIRAAGSRRRIGDIGAAIQEAVLRRGFRVVKGLTGHGIGRNRHEDPTIFNEGKRGTGLRLKPGMAFAIEPMVSMGSPHIVQLPDESYATADGSISVHFEHTVLLTTDGVEVLTVV